VSRVAYAVTIKPVASTPNMSPTGGTLTLFTPSLERAQQLVNEKPTHRSYCEVPWGEVPPHIRAKFEPSPSA